MDDDTRRTLAVVIANQALMLTAVATLLKMQGRPALGDMLVEQAEASEIALATLLPKDAKW